jgi:hypothetical protein
VVSSLGVADGVPMGLHPCLSDLIKSFSSDRGPERPRVQSGTSARFFVF